MLIPLHPHPRPPCVQSEPGEEVKYGSLLANLQERVIQTDQGMVVLSSQMSPGTSTNTDLSTLASVVTTLATMGKESEDNAQSAADALSQVDTSSSEQVMAESNDSVAKAFDTLAKACQETSVQPVSHHSVWNTSMHVCLITRLQTV